MSTDYSFITDINSIVKVTRRIEQKKVEEEKKQLEEMIRIKKEEKRKLLLEEQKKQLEEQRKIKEKIEKRRKEKQMLLEQKKRELEEQLRFKEILEQKRLETIREKKIKELKELKEHLSSSVSSKKNEEEIPCKEETSVQMNVDSSIETVTESPVLNDRKPKTYTVETIKDEPDKLSEEETSRNKEENPHRLNTSDSILKQKFFDTIKTIMNSNCSSSEDVNFMKNDILSKFTFHSTNEDDIDYKLKEISSKQNIIKKIKEVFNQFSQNLNIEERENVHDVIIQFIEKLENECINLKDKINAFLTPISVNDKKNKLDEDEGMAMGVDGFTQPMGVDSSVETGITDSLITSVSTVLMNPVVAPVPMNPDEPKEETDDIEEILNSEEANDINSHFNTVEDLKAHVFPWLLPYTYDSIVGLLAPNTELKIHLKAKKDELTQELKILKELNKKLKLLMSSEKEPLKVFKLTYFFYKTKAQIENINSVIKKINKELK